MRKAFLRTLSVAAASLMLWTLPLMEAQADVWGFVDERGVAHFSAERLDERYEFYFPTPAGVDLKRARTKAAKPAYSEAPPPAPAKLLAFFEKSPNYRDVEQLLHAAAREQVIEYELLQAVIATESGFDAGAVSPRGAVGLMQVMPSIARHYGVQGDKRSTLVTKLKDPRVNIRAGSRHLRDMMSRFPGRLELALAAYNAGLTAVRRAGNRMPRYKETQNYVKTVLQLHAVLRRPAMRQGARHGPVFGRPQDGRAVEACCLDGRALPSSPSFQTEIH
jgi:soluble lytic murein transglycosylase-like protein